LQPWQWSVFGFGDGNAGGNGRVKQLSDAFCRIPQTYLRFLVGAFFADFDLGFAAFATGFFPKSPSSQP
jgi:hypothetical protein